MAVDTSLEACFQDPCGSADKLFGEIKGIGGRTNPRRPDKPAKQQSADQAHIPLRRQRAAEGKDALINSPLIAGAYRELGNAVVGKGRRLKPNFNAKRLGLTPEQHYELTSDTKCLWMEDMLSKRKWIDQAGDQTLPEMEKSVLEQTMAVGETYTLAYWFTDPIRPFRLSLGIIDDDRIRTPLDISQEDREQVVAGHRKSDAGRTRSYFIHDWHRCDPRNKDDSYTEVRRYNEFGREQVIHTYIKKQPGLTRGLSSLTSAFDKMKCFDKYKEIRLDKAIMQMAMAFVVKSNDKNILGQMLGNGMMDDGAMKKVHALGMKKVLESQKLIKEGGLQFDGVKAFRLLENEEAELLTANQSTNNDKQFVDECLTEIARATGLTKATITQDFEASYSAARATMISFYREVENLGHYIVDDWLQSVYANWLEDNIQSGRLVIPNYPEPMMAWMHFVSNREWYCNASFLGPAREEIDSAKTMQAALMEQQLGTFCHQEFFDRFKSMDYEEAFAQQAAELKSFNKLLGKCGYDALTKKEALAWLRPKHTLLANADIQSEAGGRTENNDNE